MTELKLTEESLKQACKEAVVEVLSEHGELLRNVFLEAIEDFALARAIREGQQSEACSRDEIVDVLRGNG